MHIRPAQYSDSEAVTTCLMLPLENILYSFMNQKDYETARKLLLHFVAQENNQYSYQNCVVAEEDGNIIAALAYYDGADLIRLREPIQEYIQSHYNSDFNPEDETQAGEFYIDSLGVLRTMQGRGLGTQLLQFLIEKHVVNQNETVGLLVSEGNPNAKRLYLKLGFKPVGKKTLLGYQMEHLQVKP